MPFGELAAALQRLEKVKEDTGSYDADEDNAAEVAAAGMAWVKAVLDPLELDVSESAACAESIVNATVPELLRLVPEQLTYAEVAEASIGAGWFNGLAVGLDIGSTRPGGGAPDSIYAWMVYDRDEKWGTIAAVVPGETGRVPLVFRDRRIADALRKVAIAHGEGLGRPVALRQFNYGKELDSWSPTS